MRPKNLKLSILLSATTLLISGCSEKEITISEPESRPAKLITVSTGDQSFQRTFPATSEAGDKATLSFRVSGQLASIEVPSGTTVKAGQLLAKLDDDEIGLILKQAKAQYMLAEVQFERYSKLREDKVVSEQDYDNARANQKSAESTLNQATANLSYTELVAPYDGVISYIEVENHEWVSAKQAVMNIQGSDILKISFQLPDYLLSRFTQQDVSDALMTFDSAPNESYPVQFYEIDTEADSKTGSYRVTLTMQKPSDKNIFPGMSGEVSVVIPKGEAQSLPDTAIFECESQQCVWRVNEKGFVELTQVTLTDDGTVVDGLSDGDLIVMAGVKDLTEGMQVREWVKERGL